MRFEDLATLLIDSLIEKIEAFEILSLFAKNRANFEGWLKVEVCDILQKDFDKILPENSDSGNTIDIVFKNHNSNKKWAIELKTVPTQYKTPHTLGKGRSIDNKKKSIIEDIEKLRTLNFDKKIVLFLVYPLAYENQFEEKRVNMEKSHLQYIQEHLRRILSRDFIFTYRDIGKIYIGLV